MSDALTQFNCDFCYNQWNELWEGRPENAPASLHMTTCQACYPLCLVGESVKYDAWDRSAGDAVFADLHLTRGKTYKIVEVVKYNTATMLILEGFPARSFSSRVFCPEDFNRCEKENSDAERRNKQ